MTRLCLNMIVKNEAARIGRCLASVAPHIVSWGIVDTGSTDGTQALIRDFFGARSIPGLLSVAPFIDFSTTRNQALENGRNAPGNWTHFLLVDADMELVAPDGFPDLAGDCYRLLQRSGSMDYWNARLVRRDVKAQYRGVTHEYLDVEGTIEELAGPYFIDHADGANRPDKAERDIALLERAVAANRDDVRSWFYLAQSYKDAGRFEDAAMAYSEHQRIGSFEEEAWYGGLALSRVQRALGDPGATHEALKAFERRPSRLEPLADLARHYRELGLNEVALMFARRGLNAEQPEDLLFVEKNATEEIRSTFAISAFYSKDEETRALGHDVCDALALDRGVSPEVRDLARRNLFWYAESAAALMPSFTTQQMDFVLPKGYRAMNPSVARDGDRLTMIIRCVNYEIDDQGCYRYPDGDLVIRTRNFLTNNIVGLLEREIRQPSGPVLYDDILGFEDMRLFRWRSRLWAVATCLQHDAQARAQQFLVVLTSGPVGPVRDLGINAHDEIPLIPDNPSPREKNWMPLVVDEGTLRFIYRCDPTRILDETGATISESEPEMAADSFSGGSQAIKFDGGWLALIHEAMASPIDGKRCYQHRWVWFDDGLVLKKTSRRFFFQQNNQIEFAAGLAWHPDDRRLVVSYGIKDREAWLASVDANEVRQLLGPKELALDRAREPIAIDIEAPASSGAFRFRLDDTSWVTGQTNHALAHLSGVDYARTKLAVHDLPRHPDYPKSWDSYIALWHAFNTTRPDQLVIDAGGTRESVFLPGLARLGFTKLLNMNLDETRPETIGRVSYSCCDITRTGLGDKTAHFVACLSVLEHGVDCGKFLAEMARIITPGGHLFLSVDYWEDKIDAGDRTAFGAPVKIFDADEIFELGFYAKSLGLNLISDFDHRCQDRVVNWLGLDFTFLNLLFQRE